MGMASPLLGIACRFPIRASHAGLYVCPGEGRHEKFKLNTFELILVRQGLVEMYEEDRKFTVGPGQTLLLWPHRWHGGIGSYQPRTQFYWLHFVLERSRLQNHGETIEISQFGAARRPERLIELFHRYLHDHSGARYPGPAADLLACEILLEAASPTQSCSPNGFLASKTKALIDADFPQELTAKKIAGILGYSEDYIGQKFQETFGQTAKQYLNQRRVQEARLLLRESTLRLKEIALRCGFSSEQYLCRVFRAHEGITPSIYRSLHSRTSINIR